MPDSLFEIGIGESPEWSINSDTIVYVADSSIYIFDYSEKVSSMIIEIGRDPTISPDNQNIAFERDKDILIYNLNTNLETKISRGLTPSWSASGERIAFANESSHRRSSYVHLEGGSYPADSCIYYYSLIDSSIYPVRIENHLEIPGTYSHPEWGRNDSILFFCTDFWSGPVIWYVDRDGGIANVFNDYSYNPKQAIKAMDEYSDIGHPSWSETLKALAYTQGISSETGGTIYIGFRSFERYGVNAGGNYGCSDYSWSPNGLLGVFVHLESQLVLIDSLWFWDQLP